MASSDDAKGALKSDKGAATNGLAAPSRRSSTALARRPGVFARLFSIAARLLTYYSIFTLFFRCPASLEDCDESSSRICKPYFQAKHFVQPYLHPYYDVYAAPYVQAAQPYYRTFDRTVIAPAREYAVRHGAPQVEQLQALTRQQWDKNVQPQLSAAQSAAVEKYTEILRPHVDAATVVVTPYIKIARDSALQTHEDVILPAYKFVSPYAEQGFSLASTFATGTVVPTAVWTWHQVAAFVDGTVWPWLQVVYVETVEPQLEKIGQRLGRYSEMNETRQKTVNYSTASTSFTKPTPSSTAAKGSTESVLSSAATDGKATAHGVSASSTIRVPPPPVTQAAKLQNHAPITPPDEPEEDEDEERRLARETVAEDLRAWQEKYAKAADEGALEVEKRIDEISTRMVRRNARTTGASLAAQLDRAVETELAQLRAAIVAAVAAVADGSVTVADGEAQILAAVRRAGTEIKGKAQAVRLWREGFSKELEETVNRAAENHFTILSSIRDLALQKIGMKWAWMEGVTYRDWAKYHQLKGRFDEWERDLEQLIVTHPALGDAQRAAQAVEDEAMWTAQSAAKELARLKQVGSWKLAAGDVSDEFDSDVTKAAADKVAADKLAAIAAAAAEPANVADVDTEATEAEVTEVADDAAADVAAVDADTPAVEEASEVAPETVPESVARIAETIAADAPANADIIDVTETSSTEGVPTEAVGAETDSAVESDSLATDSGKPAVEATEDVPEPTVEAAAEDAAETVVPESIATPAVTEEQETAPVDSETTTSTEVAATAPEATEEATAAADTSSVVHSEL